ncbi:hypothetical protein SERP0894 [Staphylococcus epidermidis RP62A]|uniref:Uncharacterized protein n=1 Tax=Staphylococcus epidermidis (strain ATCC 35984 / DSM 28319 / BCRC 17069 / CCUG 31568 / BM 3577 / RP62A) TaxID=176279 RepID=Q5HPL7_STAEQ|nr:hypothetical protein SERP0894 [Staphylococcus epidermidis RP62A]
MLPPLEQALSQLNYTFSFFTYQTNKCEHLVKFILFSIKLFS